MQLLAFHESLFLSVLKTPVKETEQKLISPFARLRTFRKPPGHFHDDLRLVGLSLGCPSHRFTWAPDPCSCWSRTQTAETLSKGLREPPSRVDEGHKAGGVVPGEDTLSPGWDLF